MAPSAERRTTTRAPLLTARQVRDLFAVLCIVSAVAGMLTVLFLASPLAGFGGVATLVGAFGLYLGNDR